MHLKKLYIKALGFVSTAPRPRGAGEGEAAAGK